MSAIEIARGATMSRTVDLARERRGTADESLVPDGHHKANISLPCLDNLAHRPDGDPVPMTGGSPTPAGDGETTTVGLIELRRP